MTEDNLEKDVDELRRRIAYLEQAVGESYEKHRFERQMERVFPGEPEICEEITGYSAKMTMPAHKADMVLSEVDRRDGIEWQLRTPEDEDGVEVYVSTELIRQ